MSINELNAAVFVAFLDFGQFHLGIYGCLFVYLLEKETLLNVAS